MVDFRNGMVHGVCMGRGLLHMKLNLAAAIATGTGIAIHGQFGIWAAGAAIVAVILALSPFIDLDPAPRAQRMAGLPRSR